MRRQKTPVCLCRCGEPVHSRGLAYACYQALRRRVAAGKITWDELIESKDALPATPLADRRRKNPHGAKIDRMVRSSIITGGAA